MILKIARCKLLQLTFPCNNNNNKLFFSIDNFKIEVNLFRNFSVISKYLWNYQEISELYKKTTGTGMVKNIWTVS